MSAVSKIITGLSTISIGLGVPFVCFYFVVNYGFDYWIAGIISFVAVIVGGGIIIVGMTAGPLSEEDDYGEVDRERLRMFRNQQKAALVEMDDMITILSEIRDALKSEEI